MVRIMPFDWLSIQYIPNNYIHPHYFSLTMFPLVHVICYYLVDARIYFMYLKAHIYPI